MLTTEERVEALHARMAVRSRNRERQKNRTMGLGCGALTLCLALLIFGGAAHPGGTAGLYAGSTMLFENAGVYVLTALIAFMIGVVVTVLCLRYRSAEQRRKTEGKIAEEEKTL